jgi:phosphate acyltransferase
MATIINRIRVGVDAMGGDSGPQVVVEGALAALRDSEERISVVFFGDRELIQGHLRLADPRGALAARYEVVHAAQAVDMGEDAAGATRRKKDSSLAVGVRAMKDGASDAFFSAGDTGATVAAALVGLGRLPGVQRPALATLVPADTERGFCVMLDVGATKDCKPPHLQQFALMGDLYARHIMGVADPRIGLLNIGEEAGKGNELAKESHALLTRTPIRFVGNVEGRDIFRGSADVVITDGFTGNVVLKFIESVYAFVTTLLLREIKRSGPLVKTGAFLLTPAGRGIRRRLDYAEYGGAPLLGVDGVCIIGHGRSSAVAVKNGVKMAARFVEHALNEQIRKVLARDQEQHAG